MGIQTKVKGFLTVVHPIQEVGENKTKVQKIEIMTPGWTDAFGDKKGKDEYWQLDLIGDRVAQMDLLSKVKPDTSYKVEVLFYISSDKFYLKEDVKKENLKYSISCNLQEIRFFD